MNEAMKTMWELQRYNDVVLRCRHEVEEAESTLKSIEVLLRKENDNFSKAKDKVSLLRREVKTNEITLEEISTRITQCENRKMTVNSNKELTSIDNELAKATNDKSIVEEKLLEMMESLEKSEKDFSLIKSKLEDTVKKSVDKKETLKSRINRLQLLQKENEDKYITMLPVLGSYRPKFEKLALSKDGKAIVAIENGACAGCRFTLSADIVSSVAMSSEPSSCTNCGRYLYSD